MFLKAIACFIILPLIEKIIYISGTEYVASTEKVNFFEAFALCQKANMRLATIKSCEDEASLTSFLAFADTGYGNGYWLGATNLPNNSSRTFYWLTTGEPVIYADWTPDKPDNPTNEHCVQWWADETDGKGWNDIRCIRNIRYVCEKDWD